MQILSEEILETVYTDFKLFTRAVMGFANSGRHVMPVARQFTAARMASETREEWF